MDHELKQRLIGAVVVTALCAIFIPMLFDDPVDNSGQLVSELNIPAPVDPDTDKAGKLPSNAERVLKSADPEPLTTEPVGDTLESTGAVEEVPEEAEKQARSGESLYAESEGYTREDAGTEEAVEQPIAEPEENQPKPHPKQASAERPLPAETGDGARKNIVPKAQVRDIKVEAMAQESAKVKKVPETVKPIIVKKTENEPLTGSKDAGPKVSTYADATKQSALKQPNTAKILAAAVAEAKKPTVVPKESPKLVRWYIQIGSFTKRENAMSLWDSLREQGLPASLDTVQTDKGTSYRLRVGPELDGKKAAAMKLRLDKQNIKAILISE
ncbi:SPOR domain-containing protein [Methylobacter sp.]|uniref:SPOR domain-containing protein n=1 Tax=Methylobacter sp. TaxID=2051955 RepID=UPI0025E2ACFA|nr:SPOR domain-containing protein [Methylobacter sp.]